MTSQDVLSLSLDDIIKMKGRKRASYSRQGQAQRLASTQEHFVNPGRGQSRGWGRARARGRGRGRGASLLSSKFTVQRAGSRAMGRGMSAVQNRGSNDDMLDPGQGQAGQGRKRGGAQRGRSGDAQSGRSRRGSSLKAGRKDVKAGRGSGSVRERGGTIILGRSRDGIIQRGSMSQQQLGRQKSLQNITALDSSFRPKLARRKIQQTRKTMVLSQQSNRTRARLSIINAKRGIQKGMNPVRGAGSLVSLSSQHGLTISIRNNIASIQTQRAGFTMKMRPRLDRSKIKQQPAASYGPAMFTVVNDQALPPEPPVPALLPTRKIFKRNMTSSKEQRDEVASPVMVYTQQNSHPAPEPHRQMLDPKVQKEIAMLQGKEMCLNNGPGPGVKGFRHVPSNTARSLNERFTEERMITT